ncbi:MAG: LytTR family DNA-binding domain-containing protein [Coriobacteriia bacterium]|nr:LytTR family DNA-binding domain-containing protein [Coriobacteriia bacterium]
MYRIAICDGNRQHRNDIETALGKILFRELDNDENYQIESFSNGVDLIAIVEGGVYDFDLLFLETKLPGINPEAPSIDGMLIARYIREKSLDTEIIFITESEKYVYEGYTVHAYDYLVKPVALNKLSETVKRFIYEKENNESGYLLIGMRGSSVRLSLKDIYYFESDRRIVRAHTENEVHEFYSKLDDVGMKVNANFIRTHNSYLVNRSKITSMSAKQVNLINGENVPISRKYLPNVKEKLND